jgi:hypothetical protein
LPQLDLQELDVGRRIVNKEDMQHIRRIPSTLFVRSRVGPVATHGRPSGKPGC